MIKKTYWSLQNVFYFFFMTLYLIILILSLLIFSNIDFYNIDLKLQDEEFIATYLGFNVKFKAYSLFKDSQFNSASLYRYELSIAFREWVITCIRSYNLIFNSLIILQEDAIKKYDSTIASKHDWSKYRLDQCMEVINLNILLLIEILFLNYYSRLHLLIYENFYLSIRRLQ